MGPTTKQFLQRALGTILRVTRLQYLPVRVRRGLLSGARWTLYPWTAYWRGDYESEVARAILAWGDLRGKVCWDLGAHFGYYSVAFAQRTGPGGQVVAVEPLPSNYARLERHRRMNRMPWLITQQCAASDVSGVADFFNDLREGDTTVHLAYDGEVKTPDTPIIPVRTVRLDDLVANGTIRPPDFIKIDVEGHGYHALRGAIDSIRLTRPVILMGFHSPQEVDGTEELLRPLGYQFTAVGPRDPLHRIGADYVLQIPAPAAVTSHSIP